MGIKGSYLKSGTMCFWGTGCIVEG